MELRKLLKNEYPKKYKLWLEKERARCRINYQKKREIIECSCGRKVVNKYIDKHKETKIHKSLMKRRKMIEKMNKKFLDFYEREEKKKITVDWVD